MVHAIRMPKPGQMTEECTVVTWHKKEGDPVKRGDVLFEIETDKSAMEVESFEKIGEDKSRRHYSNIRCVAESARPNITDQQRFRFAALLCLNIVGNKEVRNWVLGCLDESNGSPETARSFSGRLMSMISEDLDPSEAYISPAHPLSNAVSSGDYVRMCAYSSHRSACDSPDILDLQAFAKASVSMTKDQVLRSAGA